MQLIGKGGCAKSDEFSEKFQSLLRRSESDPHWSQNMSALRYAHYTSSSYWQVRYVYFGVPSFFTI